MKPESIRTAVDDLSRLPGVRGALVVDGEAGVPVAAELMYGVDGTAVAALAASLHRRCGKAVTAAELGDLDTLQLEADGGHLLVSGSGDLIVAVVAERNAQLGLLRLEAHRTAEALR